MAISSIQGLTSAGPVAGVTPLPQAAKPGGEGFEKVLTGLLDDMKAAESQAATEVARLAAGKTDNVHQAMLALGKSEIQFNYMMEVRNRLVEAYKEINRMSV
jgi:flagellar hook-basal body complex protein FliE